MNKPVAWMNKETEVVCKEIYATKIPYDMIPLYTHPTDLTDEEIVKTMVQFDVYSNDDHCLIEAGRAILRKANEK